LTSEIIEKNTLPILAKLLKSIYPKSEQTKYYKNKPIYITLGYLGVHSKNGRNKFIKKIVKNINWCILSTYETLK